MLQRINWLVSDSTATPGQGDAFARNVDSDRMHRVCYKGCHRAPPDVREATGFREERSSAFSVMAGNASSGNVARFAELKR